MQKITFFLFLNIILQPFHISLSFLLEFYKKVV